MSRVQRRWLCVLLAVAVLVLLPQWLNVRWFNVRWDLTNDKRYTIHQQTVSTVNRVTSPLDITLYLDGDLSSDFRRLRQSAVFMVDELHYKNRNIRLRMSDIEPREYSLLERRGFRPVVIQDRTRDGKSVQQTVWPYMELKTGKRSMVIPLLKQNKGLSPEENLNESIENLEFVCVEAIYSLLKDSVERIAFLEGHGELGKEQVYDWCEQLRRYFQIDRGVIGNEAGVLDGYRAVIIADPQRPFSETDKYVLDQYLMKGGRLFWLVNGVRFSDEMLSQNGVTPIVPLDLNLNDMLFRYGVRINPALVQDLQCLRIPVDVSDDPQRPNYQPLPWTYAPLLLTSESSPITHNTMQVSAQMASCVDIVGGEDGIKKDILLATSTASSLTPTPAQIDLSDLSIDRERFRHAFMPVGVSLEGQFTSFFTHRILPDELITGEPMLTEGESRQVVVAAGSVAMNEWQDGEPLAAGFDRYSKTQFGNRDFLVQAVLWLTDDADLLSLRHKSVQLRLLNEQRAYQQRSKIEVISVVLPIFVLLIIGILVWGYRRYRYTHAV